MACRHHMFEVLQSDIFSECFGAFISQHCEQTYPRENYREFFNLAALSIGLDVTITIRKFGALHRARWMAKAIYSLKIQLLFEGNEAVIKLTAREL